jgi:hypothetical protein
MDRGMMEDRAFQDDSTSRWWARLLRGLVPFGRLVTPSVPVDPVVEIGLPDSSSRKDTSMISAYYLSFYE